MGTLCQTACNCNQEIHENSEFLSKPELSIDIKASLSNIHQSYVTIPALTSHEDYNATKIQAFI